MILLSSERYLFTMIPSQSSNNFFDPNKSNKLMIFYNYNLFRSKVEGFIISHVH